MYGLKDESVNYMWYKLYSSTYGRLEVTKVPPCSDSLKLHTSWTCCQVYVTSDKVNFRPDINIRLAFEKQNQKKKKTGDQEFAWLLKQFGAPVP